MRDSPPIPPPRGVYLPNPRNPGRFFGPGTSRPLAGAGGGGMDTGEEGSSAPPITAEERIAQMEAEMGAMRTENVQLLEELTQARQGNKGKDPDRGRPSGPPLRKPRTDHFSPPETPELSPSRPRSARGVAGRPPGALLIDETHVREARQV